MTKSIMNKDVFQTAHDSSQHTDPVLLHPLGGPKSLRVAIDVVAKHRALQLFDRANPKDAKQVLAMWLRDADYLDAVEQIADAAKPATDT